MTLFAYPILDLHAGALAARSGALVDDSAEPIARELVASIGRVPEEPRRMDRLEQSDVIAQASGEQSPLPCIPLVVDQIDWESRDYRAAAGVIGTEAYWLMRKVTGIRPRGEYWDARTDETALLAMQYAVMAAHYGRLALGE